MADLGNTSAGPTGIATGKLVETHAAAVANPGGGKSYCVRKIIQPSRARPLGSRQRDLLGHLAGIHTSVVVGDGLTAGLAHRGLLTAEPDGSFARITPAGLRAVADEIEAGRLKGWSPREAPIEHANG